LGAVTGLSIDPAGDGSLGESHGAGEHEGADQQRCLKLFHGEVPFHFGFASHDVATIASAATRLVNKTN
jgi:hypothetical protein